MRKEEMKEKSMELVGILQAISVVAKKLSQRLMRIEAEVNRREESLAGKSPLRKYCEE